MREKLLRVSNNRVIIFPFIWWFFKKDVLTKIHGGGARDRKRKLLDKQKKGKTRSKQFGRVEIPQEAFIGVLKISKD